MTIQLSDRLAIAAAQLKRRMPNDWEAFMKVLSEYNEDLRERVISSPADKLYIAQGRAQQSGELLKLLSTAVQTATAIEAKQRK